MVLSKNVYSTAVKVQFAAKVKDVLGKTSFQLRNHCLKGKQHVFDTFCSQFGLVWATRTDVKLHTGREFSSIG